MRNRFWVLAIWTVMATAAYAGDPLPDRLPVTLRHTYLQALPPQVLSVRVSPDGRPWFVLDAPGEDWTTEQAKAVIEREFDQPMPQAVGVNLLGWGRDGRLWVTRGNAGRSADLLGYDGKKWFQFKTHAYLSGEPVVLADSVIFPGKSGIGVFDGEKWHEAMVMAGSMYPARIAPDPNGQTAVAYFRNGHPLNLFADGQWLPLYSADVKDVQSHAIVSCRYGVFLHVADRIYQLQEATDEAASKTANVVVASWIKQLAGGDAAARKKAGDALEQIGPPALQQIKIQLGKTEAPELRLILRRLILVIEKRSANATVPANAPQQPEDSIAISQYHIQRVSFMRQLDSGHVLIGVTQGKIIEPKADLEPGLLVIPPDGDPWYLPSAEAVNCGLEWWANANGSENYQWLKLGENRYRLPGHQRTRISRSGYGNREWENTPALVLDLKNRTLTPDTRDDLAAIDGQGRRYVGPRSVELRRRADTVIEVITPGAPDDRKFIHPAEVVTLDTASYGWGGWAKGAMLAMCDDGTLCAVADGKGLQRYDGQTWQAVPGGESLKAGDLIAVGPRGAVIAEHNTGDGMNAALLFDGQVLRDDSVEHLIQNLAETVAPQFKGGSLPGMMQEKVQIVADAADHIWLRRSHDVQVLVDGQWIKDEPPLIADSRKSSRYRMIAPVDGGRWMYISNLVSRPALSYFAQMRGGEIYRMDAPPCNSTAGASTSRLYANDGALWVGDASRMAANQWRRDSYRLVSPQQIDPFKAVGYPVTSDRAGHMIACNDRTPQDQPITTINIVDKAGLRHSIVAPGLQLYVKAACDQPGSVYLTHHRGLVHLSANDPRGRPTDYHLDDVCHFADQPCWASALFASSRGYLALVMNDTKPLQLWIVRLPLELHDRPYTLPVERETPVPKTDAAVEAQP